MIFQLPNLLLKETYLSFIGDAEAIIAAGEESFNREHELEIPVSRFATTVNSNCGFTGIRTFCDKVLHKNWIDTPSPGILN